MFNKKGKKDTGPNKVLNLYNLVKLVKFILLIAVLWFVYVAFVQIPSEEIQNRYYIDLVTQNEDGTSVNSTVKISEARSLCHFQSIRQAQEASESTDLPENFNPSALYENQFVICLRSVGL